MPSKHSKNAGGRHHYFSYEEKHKAGLGSINQRIGNDSQLQFGFCPLTLNRINEAVVTPSGRMYEREAILEYLLTKTKELKELRQRYDKQMLELEGQDYDQLHKLNEIKQFSKSQENASITNRSLTQVEQLKSVLTSRKRIIDDTTREEHLTKLKQVSPWIPQFTPSAKESMIQEPPKRPLSPFSRDPLRSKDLIPVTLTRESIGSSSSSSSSSDEKFICPISRYILFHQLYLYEQPVHNMLIQQTEKR